MKTPLTDLYNWIDERLGLREILEFAQKKTVPVHAHTFWYYWGGLSLFFFLVQVFTGVLLLVYYRPGPDAYESVRQITFDTNFGWLIRSVHSWASNLMVLAVLIHMFSVFFMRAYRKPREFGWWSGLALLLLTMIFGFSGYLLPMNELAYFATKVGLEIPATIPWIGPKMAALIRGGMEVNEFTVQRFFALHVVVLPALFLPVLGFHLWLVQKHGNALPPSEEARPVSERKSMPFFPNFLLKDFAMWLIALNVLALLAALFPWDLGQQADSLKPAPTNIHPEWYFMSSFQVLKLFGQIFGGNLAFLGEVMGMFTFTAGLVLWLLVPLYDTSTAAGRRARNTTYFGLLTLGILVVTTLWGYLVLQ
ncbi:MAG: cytochrome bc complex cytochrome b subunit [Verrucomicrobia bacterium]|nr:cytochrome bc complex cytochrome b subunit [Verrucomicrobiota bacterium]